MTIDDVINAKLLGGGGGGGGGSTNTIETIETAFNMRYVFSNDAETVDLFHEIQINNATIYIDTVYNGVPVRLGVASVNGTTAPYKITFTGAVFSEALDYTNTLSLYLEVKMNPVMGRYRKDTKGKVSNLGTVSNLELSTPATVTIVRHPLN